MWPHQFLSGAGPGPLDSISKIALVVRVTMLVADMVVQRLIASEFYLTHTLIVFSTDDQLAIPWEWLRPQPTPEESDFPMLCEMCQVIRWPATVIEGILLVNNHVAAR